VVNSLFCSATLYIRRRIFVRRKKWLAASTARLSLRKIRRKILHVQYFSHNSAENVGSQPYFSRIFTYRDNSAKPNVSRISFQPSAIFKNSVWGSILMDGPDRYLSGWVIWMRGCCLIGLPVSAAARM